MLLARMKRPRRGRLLRVRGLSAGVPALGLSALGLLASLALVTPAAKAADNCPNATFRTGASAMLPDCRAYEQVTPTDKGNGGVGGGEFNVGTRVTPSGHSAIWGATDAFLGAPSFAAVVPYSSYRFDSDWESRAFGWRPAIPPDIFGSGGINQAPILLSEDGTKSITLADRNPETGEELQALFLFDLLTGDITQLTGQPVGYSGGKLGVVYSDVGADPGLENIWFSASWELTDRAAEVGNTSRKFYHYSVADGELSFASFDESGNPINGEIVSAGFAKEAPMKNYVSADGQVAYFRQTGGGTSLRLYRAEAGAEESALVTASENPGSTGPETGSFQGADTSGNRVFFRSTGKLVPEAQGGNELYLYDHSEPEGQRLILVSKDQDASDPGPANVGFAVGNSDDGSIIYFTAANQLIPGEDSASGQKLYRWEEGNLEFIARINATPNGDSSVSPDGRYAMFMSALNLEPGVNTGGFAQAYRYDHETGELNCVSCNPNGANTVEAEVSTGFMNTLQITHEPRRFLSDDGRVNFSTKEALIPERDTNEQLDVYTWKEGQLDLISTGRAESPSRFADASADGSSIFFTTREQLVASDIDDAIDLYAARVNGGLERVLEQTGSPCTSSECQGGAPAAPERQGDATQGYRANDQVVPARPRRVAARARAQRVSHRGFTRITIRAAVPGRVVIQGPAIRRTGKAFRRAGVRVVRTHLTRRAKRALARRGALRTKARVVFRAQGGGRSVKQVSLTFRLKVGNR